MNQLEKYYRMLELEPGASLDEVNQSYRDMVLVWHPDRFANHPRLQQKAHAKIQEINEAREQLQALERIAQTIASPTKFTAKPSPKPHSQSNVQDFYRESVKKAQAHYKRAMENNVQFSCANKYETCDWLD